MEGKGYRRGPGIAMAYLHSDLGGRRRNILNLPGLSVETIKLTARAASINNLWVDRIWKNVTTLSRTDRMPVSIGDLSVVAAAHYRRGAAILLRAVHPVRKLIVHRNVIKLRRRLVVPTAPRLTTVQSNNCPLIDARDHPSRIFRVDPKRVVVVAAGRASDRLKNFAAVAGAIKRDV